MVEQWPVSFFSILKWRSHLSSAIGPHISPQKLLRISIKFSTADLKQVKVKLSLCFINEELCCENILESGGLGPPLAASGIDWGDWKISLLGSFTPTISDPSLTLDRMLGGPQTQSEQCGAEKILFPLPGMESPRPVRSPLQYRLS
jgi:hypothetical protein